MLNETLFFAFIEDSTFRPRFNVECDQKRIANGVYECIELGNQRFRYRVTVQEQTFDGAPFSTKHEAKKDAAQRAKKN